MRNAASRAILVLPLFLLISVTVRAETPDNADESFRYETFVMDGMRVRFDRKTGKLERLKIENGMVVFVPLEVKGGPIQSTEQIRTTGPDLRPHSPGTQGFTPGTPQIGPEGYKENAQFGTKKTQGSGIKIFGEDNKDITDDVTDYERNAALPLIATYAAKLAPSYTGQIGERINGIIFIKNNTGKRLKRMEIKLAVPVIGKEKPEEHHFMFSARAGAIQPPQPGDDTAMLQKVDLPCPAGGVKGSPEVKISFIEFE